MLTTLLVLAVVFFFFKSQILALLEPVLELWARTFGVANTYLKGVEEDLERNQKITQAEKRHSAKQKVETLKEQGISIEDLDID